jgi:type II secretory pathway pseudopilin PulG
MPTLHLVDWIKCITSRLLRAAKREAGFTLMETLFAIVIFGTVSTALVGVLTSATAADSHSRQKTIALELAQQQIEYIRQLNYRDVGLVDGNPGGVVQETQSKKVIGLWYTLTTSIDFVDDPAPGSYVSSANYKRIQVDVTRGSDNTELATARTYVSSATPLETGGLNNGLINVTAEDFLTHALLGNVHIDLAETWDSSFLAGDYTGTDSTSPLYGVATFEGLEPTPTDPLGYYDITATLANYATLAADQPPDDPTAAQSAAHIALAKSGTSNTTIYLYKPSGMTVNVKDGSTNNNYTAGPVTVTISSAKLGVSQQFTIPSGTSTLTLNPGATIGGEPIAPGSDYEVDLATTTPYARHGISTGLTLPDGYTTGNLWSTFNVTLDPYVPPLASNVTVTVRKGSTTTNGCTSNGSLQSNASVKLTSATNPTNPTYTCTTNSSGVCSITTGVPYDTYNVSATRTSSGNTYKGTTSGVVVSAATVSTCVSIF